MHGQAYLASTDIGRNLTDDERVKVVWVRKEMAESGARRSRRSGALRSNADVDHSAGRGSGFAGASGRPAPAQPSVPSGNQITLP